jgi:hypothetical protein
MKLRELVFRHPVRVVQVFRNIIFYGKDQKEFDERAGLMTWHPMHSKSGFIEDGILFLPDSISSLPDLPICDVITIEDDNPLPHPLAPWDKRKRVSHQLPEGETNRCFNLQHPRRLDIFELKKEDRQLELHLRYGYFDIGIPERDNFKVCTLEEGVAVEIMINGKIDSTLTWRARRTFVEQHYVFKSEGMFEKCLLLKQPFEAAIKTVPTERKLVDLKKQLW